MKHFFTFLFLIQLVLISTFCNAQTKYEDVLYLKNGSIIHGLIIEQVPNVSIKIQTKDRNVFVYTIDEILKITKEEIPTGRKGREKLTSDNIKKRGFLNITEITIGKDILDNGSSEAISQSSNNDLQPSIGIQTINGFLFNPYLSIGLGLGLHSYNDISFVPVFADIHVYLFKDPVTPFISLDAGYSFTAKEVYAIDKDRKYFGGVYINPAFGVKMNTRKSKALTFSFGYRQQEARIYSYDEGVYPYYNETQSWKKFRLGYLNTKFAFLF